MESHMQVNVMFHIRYWPDMDRLMFCNILGTLVLLSSLGYWILKAKNHQRNLRIFSNEVRPIVSFYVLFYVDNVLFYLFLFVLFSVLFVCKYGLLPPGVNPTAVKYIISYHISYYIISHTHILYSYTVTLMPISFLCLSLARDFTLWGFLRNVCKMLRFAENSNRILSKFIVLKAG